MLGLACLADRVAVLLRDRELPFSGSRGCQYHLMLVSAAEEALTTASHNASRFVFRRADMGTQGMPSSTEKGLAVDRYSALLGLVGEIYCTHQIDAELLQLQGQV